MAMLERQKVIKGLTECVAAGLEKACPANCPYFLQCFPDAGLATPFMSLMADALSLLKEQEAEKEALASLASLADHRRERVVKVLYDLCELGYPHNFQHEAPWVVDYLYKLTAIIKRAYEVKNNDNT